MTDVWVKPFKTCQYLPKLARSFRTKSAKRPYMYITVYTKFGTPLVLTQATAKTRTLLVIPLLSLRPDPFLGGFRIKFTGTDTTSWFAYLREHFLLVEDDAVLVTLHTTCFNPRDFGLSNMHTYRCRWDIATLLKITVIIHGIYTASRHPCTP